jgi:cytochrome c oxidase subunit III
VARLDRHEVHGWILSSTYRCDTIGLIRDRYFIPTVYQIGVAIGILSISVFFIALILAFSFRIEAEQAWHRFTAPSLLWLSTAVLAASSVTFEAARYALRRALLVIYRGRLFGTIAFAVVFLFAQIASAKQLIDQGIGTASNPHGSAYYAFMGLHALHLTGGLAWLAVLYTQSRRLFGGSENDLRQHRRAAQAAAMYWHFMGILWVVLFYFLLRWTA